MDFKGKGKRKTSRQDAKPETKAETAPDALSPLLKELNNVLDQSDVSAVVTGSLVFVTPPLFGSPSPEATDSIPQDINVGSLSLRYDEPVNHATITLEEYLFNAYMEIESGLQHHDAAIRISTTAVMDRISDRLVEIDHLKRREWERQRDLDDALSKEGGKVDVKVLDTGL